MDLVKVAKAFGFTVPPNVNLGKGSRGCLFLMFHADVHSSKAGVIRRRGGGGGYGQQKHSKSKQFRGSIKSKDGRQFSR